MPPKRGTGGSDIPGELCAKLVVVGEAFVGKSCLAARVSKDEFSPTQEPTIGAAFVSYRTTVLAPPPGSSLNNNNNNTSESPGSGGAPRKAAIGDIEQTVKFEIWDTAGQERFRSLTPMYFRGAVAGLVVYDVSSAETLRKARVWIQDLRKTRDSLAIVLVGNKADLPDDKRQVSTEEGEALAEEEDIGFFETSAKTGMNVKEVFDYVAREVIGRNLAQPAKVPIGVGAMNQPVGSKGNTTGAANGSGGNNNNDGKTGCAKC
jgi:small GTP-binding protein